MDLTGAQKKKLRLALQAAFPDYASLARMVEEDLDIGVTLPAISDSGSLATDAFELIRWAIAHGQVMRLVLAAMESNSGSEELRAFGQMVNPPVEKEGEPERIVLKHLPYQDLDEWMQRLTELRQTVARIKYENAPVGTGFLVASDRLLTNQHVVEEIRSRGGLQQSNGVEGVTLEFGAGAEGGNVFGLSSPEPLASSPEAALDYALLQVDLAGGPQPGAPIGLTPGKIKVVDPLFILQHPDGLPLKLGIGTVTRIDEQTGRFAYNTSTNPGSSGGPCLTVDLQLAGVHATGNAAENGGILLTAILEEGKLENV